jgi:chromosome segregation ATPase
MNGDTQYIENSKESRTPNPEVVKSINALWTLLHKTAEMLDKYNEIKQQNFEYNRALEAMRADKYESSTIAEEHEALKAKYYELINTHIPEIERSLNEERDRANSLSDENNEIRKKMDMAIETSQNFEHAKKELARKNHELNARSDQIMKLKDELSNLESKVLELERRNSNIGEKDILISELNEQISSLTLELDSLKNEKLESNGIIDVLKNDLIEQEEDFSIKLGEVTEKYNDLEKQCEELNKNLELSEAENKRLALYCENLKSNNDELERKILELSESSNEYEQKISDIQADKEKAILALEDQIKQLENERKENEDQIRTYLETISKVEYKLKRLEPDHELLKAKLKECEECLDRNKQFIQKSKQLEKEIEITKSQLIIKDNAIREMNTRLASLQNYEQKCEEYKHKLKKIKSRFEEKDSEVWNLNNEIEALKEVSDRNKNKVSDLNKQLEILHRNISGKDADLANSHKENMMISKKLSDLQTRETDIQQKKILLLEKIDVQLPQLEKMLEQVK